MSKKERGTALVVDDSPVSVLLMEKVLEKEGYNVVKAMNGLEAINAYTNNLIDIVIMDIQMPIMDGLVATETIREIEAMEKRPHIPIIVWTANWADLSDDHIMSSGCNKILHKPLNIISLKKALTQL